MAAGGACAAEVKAEVKVKQGINKMDWEEALKRRNLKREKELRDGEDFEPDTLTLPRAEKVSEPT